MTLHFEIDQEVNGCNECLFCKSQTLYDNGQYDKTKFICMLQSCTQTDLAIIDYRNLVFEPEPTKRPNWCPCVEVEDGEYDICEYYREQDGRCRATRDYEWEGCSGDRSKCSHHKINVL